MLVTITKPEKEQNLKASVAENKTSKKLEFLKPTFCSRGSLRNGPRQGKANRKGKGKLEKVS